LDLVVLRAASVRDGYRVGRFDLGVPRATRQLERQLGQLQGARLSASRSGRLRRLRGGRLGG